MCSTCFSLTERILRLLIPTPLIYKLVPFRDNFHALSNELLTLSRIPSPTTATNRNDRLRRTLSTCSRHATVHFGRRAIRRAYFTSMWHLFKICRCRPFVLVALVGLWHWGSLHCTVMGTPVIVVLLHSASSSGAPTAV